MICFFRPILAFELKKCSESFEQPTLCLKSKKGYKPPFPIVLESTLVFGEIVKIDVEKNAIRAILVLQTKWSDQSLALSDESSL